MAELVDVAQTIVLAMIALSQIYSLRTMGGEMVKATRAAARAIGEQTELNRRVRNLEEEVAHLKRGTRVG